MTIRVVLADDQALIRAGFRVLIDADPDLEVVGEAADGAQAVDVARRTRADVVPTATIRFFRARAVFNIDAVAADIHQGSGCIRCADSRSACTGRNVPGPTCSVTGATCTPLSRNAPRTASSKCRPAVGAATEPSFARSAYTVW